MSSRIIDMRKALHAELKAVSGQTSSLTHLVRQVSCLGSCSRSWLQPDVYTQLTVTLSGSQQLRQLDKAEGKCIHSG